MPEGSLSTNPFCVSGEQWQEFLARSYFDSYYGQFSVTSNTGFKIA
jgi:hypothetical protein